MVEIPMYHNDAWEKTGFEEPKQKSANNERRKVLDKSCKGCDQSPSECEASQVSSRLRSLDDDIGWLYESVICYRFVASECIVKLVDVPLQTGSR